jgi:hypothetical protein
MKPLKIAFITGSLCTSIWVSCAVPVSAAPKNDIPWEIRWAAGNAPIKKSLYEAVQNGQWETAISLTQAYMKQRFPEVTILSDGHSAPLSDAGKNSAEGNWEIALGKLYLYNLQPDQAAQHFLHARQVVKGAPKTGQFMLVAASIRAQAAHNLARTSAELGHYSEAIRWLRQCSVDAPQWCGNCAEAEALNEYATTMVWKTAAGQPQSRRSALYRLLQGGLKPMGLISCPPKNRPLFKNQWPPGKLPCVLRRTTCATISRTRRSRYSYVSPRTVMTPVLSLAPTWAGLRAVADR